MSNPLDPPIPAPPPEAGERRRHPRVAPAEDLKVAVPVLLDAEVLDISPCGALLSTSGAIEAGERAHLRLILDGEPFNTWVQVVRVHPGTMDGQAARQRVGVAFTAVDDGSRRVLQRFVREESRE